MLKNTGAIIGELRDLAGDRRDYLMRCFLNGLNETLYHQTIGEIRGIDWMLANIEDITKRD